jgi:hypothetical protein
MILRSHLVFVAAVACGAALAAQPPARDARRDAVGTGTISGVVLIDGPARQPARRARVTLTNLDRTSPGQTATTDDRGTFVFRGLPAGRFELQAFKPPYLRASYGASRPDRAGTPIVLGADGAVTDLVVRMVRGGVIAGVVRDTRGRPLPGLEVRALKFGYNAVTGERSLAPPGGASTAQSDDRGEYRVYGLPPGGYLVVVSPPAAGRGNEGIRRLTSDEVHRALVAARSGGAAPATQRAGSAPPLVNHAPVFHPGATDLRAASRIDLGISEERAGVDIVAQLVPTATISGTITAPSGVLPQMLTVQLWTAAETELPAGGGLRGTSARPRPDGTYALTGIAPGTYTLKAGTGRARGAPPDQPTQWAAADINVNGQDLEVSLTLQPGVAINGRVLFEGARQPSAAELQTLAFALVAPGSGGASAYPGGGRVDANGRFTFAGVVPDTYRFTATWSSPAANVWTMKSSGANGRESFEAPLRVNPGETLEWTITYTDKPTGLTGVLQDSGGRAATDHYILVFSAERAHWIPGSRRIRMTRPATDGSYSVKGLPPGEYFVAAPTDLEAGEWNDPALLDQLARTSARITLRDGEMTPQGFRVGGPLLVAQRDRRIDPRRTARR